MRTLIPMLPLLVALTTLARAADVPAAPAVNRVLESTVDRAPALWRGSTRGNPHATVAWDSLGGRHGGGALSMTSAGIDSENVYRRAPGWIYSVDSLPAPRRIHFEAWTRGRDCDREPVLGLQAMGPGGVMLAAASTEHAYRLGRTFDWTRVEGTIDLPAGTVRCGLLALLLGNGQAWFDDFELQVSDTISSACASLAGEVPQADRFYLTQLHSAHDVIGPPVARLRALDAPTTRLRVALPLADERQVPVSFTLHTEPRASLEHVELGEDSTGRAFADLTLRFPNALRRRLGTVALSWDARVLVSPSGRIASPSDPPIPAEWPPAVRRWLGSTTCCESDAPEIRRLAEDLRAGSPGEREYIQRVLVAVGRSREHLVPRTTRVFDALCGLHQEGSCLSNAMLVAALLRAGGIPARLHSGVPTGAADVSIHYVVEAFLTTGNWMRIESTMLQSPAPDSGQVDLVAVDPEDETRGAITRPGSVDCLPWLSVSEFMEECGGCSTRGVVAPDSIGGFTAVILESRDAGRDGSAWRRRHDQLAARWHHWITSHPRPDAGGILATPFQPRGLDDLSSATSTRRTRPRRRRGASARQRRPHDLRDVLRQPRRAEHGAVARMPAAMDADEGEPRDG